MAFKPGESGNKAGKPKGAGNKTNLIREQLIPYAKELVDNLMLKVRSEDESISLSATKDALDRLYGKPSQAVDLTSTGEKIGILYVGTPPKPE